MRLHHLIQSAFLAAAVGCGGAPPGSMETGEVESKVCNSLLEGETRTYTVSDANYETANLYMEPGRVKFAVNGEATNKLKVDETYLLADQSKITVEDILYQDYAGGIHQAWFCLTADE